ncbi:trichohyalin-like [Alosa sapidissima]|uniref:trichohyalin-like n=1 Tax=Alosa sapidissima TaxID=34773 RepID=UPI001C0916B9|nr:trichohyalin-like [Alosa sapidissima]
MTLLKQEEWRHYLDCLVDAQLREMERRLQHRVAMVLSHTQQLETEWIYREASQHQTSDPLPLMDQQDKRAVMKRMRKTRGEQPSSQSAKKSHSGQEKQRGRGRERKHRTLPDGKEQGTSQDKAFCGSKKEHSESDWKRWLRQRLFGSERWKSASHTEVKQDNINKTVRPDRQHKEGERGRVEGLTRNKDGEKEQLPKGRRDEKCARADQSGREDEKREREERECHKDKQKKRQDHIRKGEMEKQIEMEKLRENEREELEKLYDYIEKLREEIRLLELEKNMEKLRGDVRLLEVKMVKGKNHMIKGKESGYKRGLSSMDEEKRPRDKRQESAKGKEMETQGRTETSLDKQKSSADITEFELVVKVSRKMLRKERDDKNADIKDSVEEQNSDKIKHQYGKSVSEGKEDCEVEEEDEDETEKVGRKEKTRGSECAKSAEDKDRSTATGKESGGHGDTNFNNEVKRNTVKEPENDILEEGMERGRRKMTEVESCDLWNLDLKDDLNKDAGTQWKGQIIEQDSDGSWSMDSDEENTRVTERDQDSDTDSLWDTDSYEMDSNGQAGEQKQIAFDSDSSWDSETKDGFQGVFRTVAVSMISILHNTSQQRP